MKKVELERLCEEQAEELVEKRDTNKRLVEQLSASRALSVRLTEDVVRLNQQHAAWVEIVAKDGKVIRAGLGAQVSRDAVRGMERDDWHIAICTDYTYQTTVQFVDDGETYRLKTEEGERLMVRKEIRP